VGEIFGKAKRIDQNDSHTKQEFFKKLNPHYSKNFPYNICNVINAVLPRHLMLAYRTINWYTLSWN
jgi:hypothetical protein